MKARQSAGKTRQDSAKTPAPPVHRATATLWFGAALLTFLAFGFTAMRGSDLWWHLATGRWIAQHRSLPAHDPFAFTTAGQRWIIDSWLSDVILHGWTTAWGIRSLVYWKWLMIVATFLGLMVLLLRRTGWNFPSSFLGSLTAIAVSAPFLDIRPHLISMLFFVVLMNILLVPRAEFPRSFWLAVPLFALWSNLHAGFTLGLGVLVLALLPWIRKPKTRTRALLLLSGCFASTLLNPHGFRVFTQPIVYALDRKSPFHDLGEWLPPFRPGGIVSPFYPYLIALFAVAAVIELRRKDRDLTALALGIVTLVMSLQSRRLIPYFAISSALLVTRVLRDAVGTRFQRFSWGVAVAAAIVATVWLTRLPVSSSAFPHLIAEDTFPVETVNFIEANHLAGHMFAYYNWGGYLHYRTAGAMPVFIDGRASAVFDPRTYVDYVRVLRRRSGWESIVNRSSAEFFLWPREQRSVISTMLESKEWRRLYSDSRSVLLVRRSIEIPETQPTNRSAYKELGLATNALERGVFDEAIAHATRALSIDAELTSACELHALAQAYRGNASDARSIIRECDDIFPNRKRRQKVEEVIQHRSSQGGFD